MQHREQLGLHELRSRLPPDAGRQVPGVRSDRELRRRDCLHQRIGFEMHAMRGGLLAVAGRQHLPGVHGGGPLRVRSNLHDAFEFALHTVRSGLLAQHERPDGVHGVHAH